MLRGVPTIMGLKELVRLKLMNEVIKQNKPWKEIEWRVLVVDQLAMKIVSSSCTMTEIADEGITLVEDISLIREPLPRLPAVYLLTPTEDSVRALIKDFYCPDRPYPMYLAAHVYFIHACPDSLIENLLKIRKYIHTLKEINISYVPYESQVFSLDYPESFQHIYNPNFVNLMPACLERIAERIATLCVSLGEYPSVRFRKDIDKNEELAQLVQQKLDAYKLDEPTMGDQSEKARSQLIILDRGVDCVSPLLHELSLQAMAYDVLPIENDVYKFAEGNIKKEVILDEKNSIWREMRHLHVSVVSKKVSTSLKEFTKTKSESQYATNIRELSQFMKKMPQYQKELNEYKTHLSLAEECVRHWKEHIQKLCRVEQILAMGKTLDGEPATDRNNVAPILLDKDLTNYDKLRIILLYVLHQRGLHISDLEKFLSHAEIPEERDTMVNMAKLGVTIQLGDKKYNKIPRKERDEENCLETNRWTPVVKDLMEFAIQGTLDTKLFPFLKNSELIANGTNVTSARYHSNWHKKAGQARSVPRLIFFILGGVTYSEMRCAYEVNAENRNWEVIIGSTHIWKPEEFLKKVHDLHLESPGQPSDGMVAIDLDDTQQS